MKTILHLSGTTMHRLTLCLLLLTSLFSTTSQTFAQAPAISVTAGIPTGTSSPGAAYGNGVYIITYSDGRVYKSTDASSWTKVVDADLTGTYTRIAFGAGQFVIVGIGGLVITSPDGSAWTTRSSGTTNNLYDVQFLQSAFYAVGAAATTRKSTDGITWTGITMNGGASTDDLMNITYGNSLFVVGARGAWGNSIYRSATAASSSWTFQQVSTDLVNKVQYLKNKFFIFTSGTAVFTSTTGTSWTNSTAALPLTLPNSTVINIGSPNQMFHGIYDGTKIYLFGYTQYHAGYGSVVSSTDGVNFTLQARTAYIVCQGSAYLNGKYFQTGNEGAAISDDGTNYHYLSGNFAGVASSGAGNYVAAGYVGDAGVLYTSSDFINWTDHTPSGQNALNAVTYTGSKYVAAGVKSVVQSTDNGATWSQIATPNKVFYGLAYGSSRLVAGGYDATTYAAELYYSADGTSWTVANTANNWYFKVKNVNGKFFALGTDNGTYQGKVMYSTDGITWSDITPSLPFTTYYYHDVVYDGTKYFLMGADADATFFSVSSAAPTNVNSWANKGTITTQPVGAVLGGYWGEGAFAYSNGHFTGSVNDLNTNEAYTLYSTDAVSWTSVASGEHNAVTGIVAQSSKFQMIGFGNMFVTADFSLVTLPVKLEDLTATLVNDQTLLKWQTASEHNSDHFTIQHSTDGSSWKNIGIVKAAGESQSVLHYQYTHAQPVSGINYYRLIQTDKDGKAQYSKTVSVFIGKSTGVRMYPNPASENVYLELPDAQPSQLTIFNSTGQKVFQKSYSTNHVEVSLQSFSRGLYKVIITQNDKRYVQQLSRQ